MKSYAEELLEQAVEDALIEEDAKFVVALVRSDNISIDEALVKLNIKEYLIRDVRFLAE
ncbi:hypothetical protein PED39_02540 [Methanomassiliicoccales archaeon LGM-RCC1]|nr:hypothetical protein [Candidatus Methanomethylophilaceae archaeon]WII08095.1 hypothetical protein PED39_02540 [Methanomassiliicoccales archaeon LGM-RCC1]